jgi:predicted enzyme related to lactoylglutathione lyase
VASHRSRLAGAYVDVPRSDYAKEVAFWGAALEHPGDVDPDDPVYTAFGEPTPGVGFMVQAVGDDHARIHLDIETDNVEAEVARLVALGATEVERIQTWVVMRDPVGTIFCVVRVPMPTAFEASATTWET